MSTTLRFFQKYRSYYDPLSLHFGNYGHFFSPTNHYGHFWIGVNFPGGIVGKEDVMGLFYVKMCPDARKGGQINPHQQQCGHFGPVY